MVKVFIPPSEFDDVLTDEEPENVQGSRDYSTSGPNKVSVPEWHLEIIRERIAYYKVHGMEGTLLEDFETELFALMKS